MEENFTQHFPICFAQLNKLLLLIFLALCPLVLETEMGLWVNVLFPTAAAMFFFGIEYVAVEIEVCYGEGDMDINLLRAVRCVECESMTMLLVTAQRGLETPE